MKNIFLILIGVHIITSCGDKTIQEEESTKNNIDYTVTLTSAQFKNATIQIGKLADFVIVEENPLQNLKVLYGTGAIKLTESNEVVRVGGVKYTIKDGVIYDAKKLLLDVKQMVDAQKEEKNWILKQPGIKD